MNEDSRVADAMRITMWPWAFLGAKLFVQAAYADLAISPAAVDLTDAFARRQLLVSSSGIDRTHEASYHCDRPDIVAVDGAGYLVPKSNGNAKVLVRVGGEERTIPVRVTGLEQIRPVDFATEVVPLLSRFGCNAGGCHGKASGQNGFKLSLFGFDPQFDYHALVSEGRGRRVFSNVPENSLLLQKAIGGVPHGGGKRLEVGTEPYDLLLTWIKAGCPQSSPSVPRVVKLRMFPPERSLRPGQTQQLAVLADYSDGSSRDVTRSAQYSSNLETVAVVGENGLIRANDQTGEATIMARYMGQVAICTAILPQGEPLASLPKFPTPTKIDELAAEKWKKLGLHPSERCDDPTFLRRVTIDLCGRLPTVDEARRFLADASPNKREALVDALLASPDYPAYFALKWSSILRNSSLAGSEKAAYAFHGWIRQMIAENRPYDEFVRGIVAASGEWQDAPAINWYWQSRDDQLHQVTADTAQVFLGLRLQCAKCHHHPYERWSQDDYYGLAGFFTRLGRKSFGEPPPYYSAPTVVIGERHPITGEQIKPKYLDGAVAEFGSEEDPRHGLVDWMTKPENPFFARAFANRMWGHFFARGLVDQVDDLRETNPASNPALLDHLAKEFVEHGFDMRHVIRLIVLSETYQRSATPTPDNRNDRQNFARYYARRLPAEVLLDAVDQACGTKTQFGNISNTARAVDLPHERFGSYFLDAFDRPKRVSACECERSTSATLSQVLLLSNSDELEDKIGSGNGRIARIMTDKVAVREAVVELYLATLSREPDPAALAEAEAYVSRYPGDPRKGLEDVLWGLLNTREFMFNH